MSFFHGSPQFLSTTDRLKSAGRIFHRKKFLAGSIKKIGKQQVISTVTAALHQVNATHWCSAVD
jgi:hypothetical protein